MHPSTKRMASIGGFAAGGSGGIGSVTYGGLRELGNITGARVISLEETPRVFELKGDAALKICHGWGTTGIITALEMPLAPAFDWIDLIVAFDDFMTAVRFGYELALADGVVKKLVTPLDWPIPSYFPGMEQYFPKGRPAVIAMIADHSIEPFLSLASRAQGRDYLSAADRRIDGRAAALRAHLEPHHFARAQCRPGHHLPSGACIPRPASWKKWRRSRRCSRPTR